MVTSEQSVWVPRVFLPVKPKDEAWAVAIRVFCFYDRKSTAVETIFAFRLP